ncbi:PaaI family thioesterase [Henriciella barbarensis]|uniref:PaaI family thioesterase n=1 Tax=Henriciella barbarensis TaxID=86342 RepID=A0A399R2D2_9PROT|nr:PaaI family thioesterase [Henriciella barbarensis]RIJ24375.1 PaaI family thioesterase [Henriciella barbarensis]
MSEENERQDMMLNLMQQNAQRIMSTVPWAQALGFELTGIEKGRAFAKVGWREDLVGDPDTGVIYGGVLTALLDNLSGVCINTALNKPMSMATLDLRIDYMRPADKGRDILAEAECYHITRNVAFTHAWAYHESRDKVIATAAGTFALNDISRWASGNAAMDIANKMLGGEK